MKTIDVCFSGVNTGSAGVGTQMRPLHPDVFYAGANTGSAGTTGSIRPVR